MKRGVAFATFLSMIISILVVVIGSAINLAPGQKFGVQDLGDVIGIALGSSAQLLFCIGLYAAAFSSAVTIPLGAALTAKQIFLDGETHKHTCVLLPSTQRATYFCIILLLILPPLCLCLLCLSLCLSSVYIFV